MRTKDISYTSNVKCIRRHRIKEIKSIDLCVFVWFSLCSCLVIWVSCRRTRFLEGWSCVGTLRGSRDGKLVCYHSEALVCLLCPTLTITATPSDISLHFTAVIVITVWLLFWKASEVKLLEIEQQETNMFVILLCCSTILPAGLVYHVSLVCRPERSSDCLEAYLALSPVFHCVFWQIFMTWHIFNKSRQTKAKRLLSHTCTKSTPEGNIWPISRSVRCFNGQKNKARKVRS